MTSEALKPCPFCGGEARLNINNQTGKREFWKGSCNVSCTSCHCVGVAYVFSSSFECSPEDIEKAIDLWNTRTTLRTEWLPIETAPKDCVDKIIWLPDGKAYTGWFAKGGWRMFGYNQDIVRVHPTHWMPLKTPPKESEGKGNKDE